MRILKCGVTDPKIFSKLINFVGGELLLKRLPDLYQCEGYYLNGKKRREPVGFGLKNVHIQVNTRVTVRVVCFLNVYYTPLGKRNDLEYITMRSPVLHTLGAAYSSPGRYMFCRCLADFRLMVFENPLSEKNFGEFLFISNFSRLKWISAIPTVITYTD